MLVASEKSITRACLFAPGIVITFIQKVIVKLVELKYVPVGSVRKLMYEPGVLAAISVLPPLM